MLKIKELSRIVFIILFFSFVLVACSRNEENDINGELINFGNVENYDSFLWKKAPELSLEKTLIYELNEYAKNKHAEITLLFDTEIEEGEPNPFGKYINLFWNEKLISNQKIVIRPDQLESRGKLELKFFPWKENRVLSGYLLIQDSNFDQINSSKLEIGKKIFRWRVGHNYIMNPLLNALRIGLIIVLLLFLSWQILLKKLIFPRTSLKVIQLHDPYMKIDIKKASRIIISPRVIDKQSFVGKYFGAKEVSAHLRDSFLPGDIIFTPKNRKSLNIRLPIGVRLIPATSTIQKGESYQVQLDKKNSITIQIR